MTDINKVVLIGRLTRDAELKILSSGLAVCKFSIANNRRKKDGDQWVDEANFFDVVLWGKSGETLNQYLIKGKQIAVDGELRQERWVQDGQNRSKIEIIASNVELLGSASGSGGGSGGGYSGGGGSSTRDYGGGRTERGGESAPQDDGAFTDDVPF